MRSAKTGQTTLIGRLIRVTGRISLILGFVVRWLLCLNFFFLYLLFIGFSEYGSDNSLFCSYLLTLYDLGTVSGRRVLSHCPQRMSKSAQAYIQYRSADVYGTTERKRN